MSDSFLYNQSEGLIVTILLVALLLTSEIGYRFGLRNQAAHTQTAKSQLGTIQGALLALLGLLLGFTFSMAVARFDARKQLVVEEANVISTAYLRGKMLPEPDRTEVTGLIHDYIDIRLKASQAVFNEQARQTFDAQSAQLQDRLWTYALAAGQRDTTSVPVGLFVQSVNDILDVKEKRDSVLSNHVPTSVLLLLMAGALITVGTVGYGCGLGTDRLSIGQAALSLLIALVILVIIDLDRPQRGLITVSQKNMVVLLDSLNKANSAK